MSTRGKKEWSDEIDKQMKNNCFAVCWRARWRIYQKQYAWIEEGCNTEYKRKDALDLFADFLGEMILKYTDVIDIAAFSDQDVEEPEMLTTSVFSEDGIESEQMIWYSENVNTVSKQGRAKALPYHDIRKWGDGLKWMKW